MNRAERRERMQPVVHALAAVTLIAQGFGNIDDPSSPRLLVVLPFAAGALAVANVVRHRRHRPPSRLVDFVSSVIEGATCALVGIAAARRGTGYVQYAWFLAAVAIIGAAIRKSRRTEVA